MSSPVKSFAARRRPLGAALLLAAPLVLGLASIAEARDDEITLVIQELRALDRADVAIAGADDFYARVTIDGETFTSKIARQQNAPTPGWRFSKVVRRGRHDIRLEIFDKDIGKPDDKIDINRVDDKRDIDFVVDTRRCRIEGFSEGYRCGQRIRREGYERKKAEITFSVEVERN